MSRVSPTPSRSGLRTGYPRILPHPTQFSLVWFPSYKICCTRIYLHRSLYWVLFIGSLFSVFVLLFWISGLMSVPISVLRFCLWLSFLSEHNKDPSRHRVTCGTSSRPLTTPVRSEDIFTSRCVNDTGKWFEIVCPNLTEVPFGSNRGNLSKDVQTKP